MLNIWSECSRVENCKTFFCIRFFFIYIFFWLVGWLRSLLAVDPQDIVGLDTRHSWNFPLLLHQLTEYVFRHLLNVCKVIHVFKALPTLSHLGALWSGQADHPRNLASPPKGHQSEKKTMLMLNKPNKLSLLHSHQVIRINQTRTLFKAKTKYTKTYNFSS